MRDVLYSVTENKHHRKQTYEMLIGILFRNTGIPFLWKYEYVSGGNTGIFFMGAYINALLPRETAGRVAAMTAKGSGAIRAILAGDTASHPRAPSRVIIASYATSFRSLTSRAVPSPVVTRTAQVVGGVIESPATRRSGIRRFLRHFASAGCAVTVSGCWPKRHCSTFSSLFAAPALVTPCAAELPLR